MTEQVQEQATLVTISIAFDGTPTIITNITDNTPIVSKTALVRLLQGVATEITQQLLTEIPTPVVKEEKEKGKTTK